MRRTSMRQRAAYLGSCTNQIGLNMSGAPPTVGRKGSLGRYIGSRVQSNQKYCGPVMYQGQIWKTNDEPCVKKVPRGESFNSGVGHIGAPRFLCNKNCKTDTQQTIFHAPIENGDTPLPGGILGTELLGLDGEEDEAPAETATLNEVSLYIESPGFYYLLGDKTTNHDPKQGENLFKPEQLMETKPGGAMENWIIDLNTFIQDHKVTKVLMKLPSFDDAPATFPDFYNFYPMQFWQLMSGQSSLDGGLYTFPVATNATPPTAKYPSVIYSLFRKNNCDPKDSSCNPYGEYTLAWLLFNNYQKNQDFKFLWIAPNSKVPFIGPGGSLTTPASGNLPSTVIQEGVNRGHWMLNDNHNQNVDPYKPDPTTGATNQAWTDWLKARNFDITWDTVQMVHAVNYFAQTVVPNKQKPLQTGIVWEVDKLEYQWTNEYSNVDQTESLSLEQLVTCCHEISVLVDGGLNSYSTDSVPYQLFPDKNWTWGLTCEAQLGGLSGVNNVTTVWAAWNSMKIREQNLWLGGALGKTGLPNGIYNVEIFVAWFTNKSKCNLGSVVNAKQLAFQNTALKGGASAGNLLLSPEIKNPGSLLYNQVESFLSTRTYKDGQPQAPPTTGTGSHVVTQYPVPQVRNPMEYDLFASTAGASHWLPVPFNGENNGLNKLWAENLRITTGTKDTMVANPNARATKSTFTGTKFVAHNFVNTVNSTFTGTSTTQSYDFGAYTFLQGYISQEKLSIMVGEDPVPYIIHLYNGDEQWWDGTIDVFAKSLNIALGNATYNGNPVVCPLTCGVDFSEGGGVLQLVTTSPLQTNYTILVSASTDTPADGNYNSSLNALALFGITTPESSTAMNGIVPNINEELVITVGATAYPVTFDYKSVGSVWSDGKIGTCATVLSTIMHDAGCPCTAGVVDSDSSYNIKLTAKNGGSDMISIAASTDPTAVNANSSANALALFGDSGAGVSYRGVFRTGISISPDGTLDALALFGITTSKDIVSVPSKYDGETFIPGYLLGTNFKGTNFLHDSTAYFTLIIDAGNNEATPQQNNTLTINLAGLNCTTVELAMQAITSQINNNATHQRDISVDILGASLGSYLKAPRVFNLAYGPPGDFEPPSINQPWGKSNGPLYTAMVSLAPEQFGGAPRTDAAYATSNWEISELSTDGTLSLNKEYFPQNWSLPKFVAGTGMQGGTALTSVGSTIFDYVFDLSLDPSRISGTTGNPGINMMYFSQVYTMAAFSKAVLDQRAFQTIKLDISNYPFGTSGKYVTTGGNVYGNPCPSPKFPLEKVHSAAGDGPWYCYENADKQNGCSYGGLFQTPSGLGVWKQDLDLCKFDV